MNWELWNNAVFIIMYNKVIVLEILYFINAKSNYYVMPTCGIHVQILESVQNYSATHAARK
jgi:hypothetical protein